MQALAEEEARLWDTACVAELGLVLAAIGAAKGSAAGPSAVPSAEVQHAFLDAARDYKWEEIRAPLKQPRVMGGAVGFPWLSNGFVAGWH